MKKNHRNEKRKEVTVIMKKETKKRVARWGLVLALMLCMVIGMMGCAARSTEATDPTETTPTEATTEPTEATVEPTEAEPTDAATEATEASEATTEPAETVVNTGSEGGSSSTGSSYKSNGSSNTGNSGNSGSSGSNMSNGSSSGSTGSSGNSGNSGNTGSSGSSGSSGSGNSGSSGSGGSTPATTHTHTYTIKVVDATCTEQGYTLHTCTAGDDSYKDAYTDALGHNWGDWETTKEATTSAEGEQTRTCSRCGATETQAIAKLEAEYIDCAALEAYGRSYGESNYDFIPKIGTRAGYAPGYQVKITTMADGRRYVAEAVDAEAADQLSVYGSTYCYMDVGVEDMGDGYYIIRVYYG